MGAELRETHISLITLVGDRAYKMKKAVKLPFLDFSTVESRAEAARREVELNRRLSPDVYLGVATVLGVDGAVCEHLVVMRRMPDDRRLGSLVRGHSAREDDVRSVAREVARFHRGCERSEAIARDASVDAVTQRWKDNLAQTRPFAEGVLDPQVHREVERLAMRYLEGRGALFESRVRQGKIVDGHGDLLADDIYCLDDGPRILDCIEFADRLRHLDVLDDIAFLAMDLEHLGARDLSRLLVSTYCEESGESIPTSLLHHYMAYRALVRSKVACVRTLQDDHDAAGTAVALLDLASEHLASARVRLVLVGGLPGTGKSTLATMLGEHLGWPVFRSDVVRKNLCGVSIADGSPVLPDRGLYRPEITERTYEWLLRDAREALSQGNSVIVDATWADSGHREAAARVAAQTATDLISMRCVTPAEVAAGRIRSRAELGRDPSDATVEVARMMAARFAPWVESETIDTSGLITEALSAALRVIGPIA